MMPPRISFSRLKYGYWVIPLSSGLPVVLRFAVMEKIWDFHPTWQESAGLACAGCVGIRS